MSKQTDTSLFIHSSTPRLYQSLQLGISNYQELGKRVLREIKAAHAFRQVEQVRQLAAILANLPFKEYQLVSQYYVAWCDCRESKYNTESLERVTEQSHTYKTKALLSRGAIEFYKGSFESALYFYAEAFNSQPTISEYIEATKAIAVIKSIEGFQQSALRDLESLIPLLGHAEPFAYHDVINSYAVELYEAGRIERASNVSKIIAASPFVAHYPEYRETISRVNQKLSKKRSTVRINLPSPEPEEVRPTAKIIPFPVKQASPAKPDTTREGFTPMHLLRFILKSVLKEQITYEQVEKICATFYSTLQEWWPDEQV